MLHLFKLFDAIKPLSPELRRYLLSKLQYKEFKKNEVILQKGNVARYIYFIESGLVESKRNIMGKERTTWFMKERDIVVSIRSFFSQTAANETIVALETTLVHYISYEELEEAYELFPDFNLHGRKILQFYYQLSEERHEMKEQTAPGRIAYLMTNQHDLFERVGDNNLARYLNMTPGTFSLQKKLFLQGDKKKK